MRININTKSSWEEIEQDIENNFKAKPKDSIAIIAALDNKYVPNPELIGKIITKLLAEGEIKTLKISNIDLVLSVLEAIKNPLKNENSLYKLDFSYTNTDDKGAVIIADILIDNPNLGELEVSYNKLSNIGLNIIFDALRNNSKMKALYFSNNSNIEDVSGISKLIESEVEVIDLGICNISVLSEDMFKLLKLGTLQEIDLSRNNLNLSALARDLIAVYESDIKTRLYLENQGPDNLNSCVYCEEYEIVLPCYPCPEDAQQILVGCDFIIIS